MLKLGTHMDNMLKYSVHVYWNQAAAAYSSLYFFIFLYLQFPSHFSHRLRGPQC